MKPMIRFPLAAALLLAATSTLAADVSISSGAKGGNYERWGHNLARLLKGQGHTPTVLRSKGASENLARVKKGEAQVGWVQGDVGMAEGFDGAEIIGALGEECVFIAVNTKGKVSDEDDLQTKGLGAKIAVGKRGAGSQVSWQYMVKLEDGYAATAAEYVGGTRALGKLAAGQVDAAMFVTAPGNLEHRLIAAVNANKSLKFIDVDDSDLNDKLPSGQPVYEFKSVDVEKGTFNDVEIQTICTPVLAIAHDGADEDLLDDLSSILLTNLAAVLQ